MKTSKPPFDMIMYSAHVVEYDDHEAVIAHIKKMVPEIHTVTYMPPSGASDIDDSFIKATFQGDWHEAQAIEKKIKRLARGVPRFSIDEHSYSTIDKKKMFDLCMYNNWDST